MFKHKQLMMLQALTSAHVGSGDNLSYIDMPIQREKHTNYPKIEASSLKGSVRHAMEGMEGVKEEDKVLRKGEVADLMGSADNDKITASRVAISDARILFFPVKSAKGIFAWVTCPSVLNKFKQDCEFLKIKQVSGDDFDTRIKDAILPTFTTELKDAIITESSKIKISHGGKDKIMLEELVLKLVEDESKNFSTTIDNVLSLLPTAGADLKSQVALIPDDDFEHFVSQSTEVITRIRINSDKGTVDKEKGALFTEEYLPPETIMYSSIFFKETSDKTQFGTLLDNIIQIGGNATLAKGMFRIKLTKGEQPNESEQPI